MSGQRAKLPRPKTSLVYLPRGVQTSFSKCGRRGLAAAFRWRWSSHLTQLYECALNMIECRAYHDRAFLEYIRTRMHVTIKLHDRPFNRHLSTRQTDLKLSVALPSINCKLGNNRSGVMWRFVSLDSVTFIHRSRQADPCSNRNCVGIESLHYPRPSFSHF